VPGAKAHADATASQPGAAADSLAMIGSLTAALRHAAGSTAAANPATATARRQWSLTADMLQAKLWPLVTTSPHPQGMLRFQEHQLTSSEEAGPRVPAPSWGLDTAGLVDADEGGTEAWQGDAGGGDAPIERRALMQRQGGVSEWA
jgi:hypothetical protein